MPKCECGRPIPHTNRPKNTRALNGCPHCDKIASAMRQTLTLRSGSDQEKQLYGTRAAINRATKKFWQSRGLPEPKGDILHD